MIGFPHFKQASFKKCNLLKQSLHIEYVLVSFIGLSQIMHEIFLGYIKSSIVSLKDLSIDFISSIFFISFIYILFIFMLLSKSVRKWANKKSPVASCDRALSNLLYL